MQLALGRKVLTSMLGSKINHIGMVVPDILKFLEDNKLLYGSFSRGPLIVNTVQKVKEMFISDGKSVIELLEPLGDDSPLSGFLKRHRHGGLVHIGMDVSDLDAALKQVEEVGGKVIVAPTSDVAFDGRKIAFVVLNGQVTEFIESH